MKKSIRLIAVILCLVMVLSACSIRKAVIPTPVPETPAPEVTEEPIVVIPSVDLRNYEGVYSEEYAHRGVMQLRAVDDSHVSVVVDWPSSAFERAHWEFTGAYDEAKQAIVYNDAIEKIATYNEQGLASERIAYTNGTGSIEMSGSALIWKEDNAEAGTEPSRFVYTSSIADYEKQQQETVTPAAQTPAPAAQTPAPAAQTPAPEPTPTPVPNAKLPIITKSPTDETVVEGGSAYFVAKYENALWAVWHFVSPDGTTDMSYEDAAKQFPTMQIVNGMYSTMQLKNIPLDFNGWKVYCAYRNRDGSTNTNSATVTVVGKDHVDDSKLPVITKSPTGETVDVGGSAYFVAKYQNAEWAVWHFVSPDGQTDLTYQDAAKKFTTLSIINGDRSTMQLQKIPAELNGWKVYCAFRNNVGSKNTDSALITVKNGTPAPDPAPTTSPAPSTVSYAGTYWESIGKRGRIEITGNSQQYYVTITWPGSAFDSAQWKFTGTFDSDGIMSYTNCTKTITTAQSDGTAVETTQYTDGTGKLIFSTSVASLYWTDEKENQGANATFVKS